MLRAISILPDPEVAAQFHEAVADIGWVLLSREVNHYPNEISLVRMVRAACPEIVFLSVESMERALEVTAILEEISPGTQIVAISRTRDPQVLEQLIRSQVHEFLLFPVCRKKLLEAVTRANEILARKPLAIPSTDLFYSYLPSKAGVGTSTIALNASLAVSRISGQRVLLSDLDLNSGVIQFLLKLQHRFSVLDAAQRADELDENNWPELVHPCGTLDVLPSGESRAGARIEPTQLHQVFDFARRHYKVISVDLSGNMEQYSIEIMRESKRIILVCAPELSSVHLARRKYQFLRYLDLADRVTLLLNRAESDSMISAAEIEDIVEIPVSFSLPNDYKGVLNAVFQGNPIEPASKLGRNIESLAHWILEGTAKPVESPVSLGEKVSGWLSSRPWKSLTMPARR